MNYKYQNTFDGEAAWDNQKKIILQKKKKKKLE